MSTVPSSSQSSTDSVNTVDGEVIRFHLGHPKNYIGVPVAVKASGRTGANVMRHLTAMAGAAKAGAQALGLLDPNGGITPFGEEVVAQAAGDESPDEYLETLGELSGSSDRFVKGRPEWHQLGRELAYRYTATPPIVALLSKRGAMTLPELVLALRESRPEFVMEVFIDPQQAAVEDLTFDLLQHPAVYRGTGTSQFKNVLYHLGVVDSPGASTDYLSPTTETWALETRLGGGR